MTERHIVSDSIKGIITRLTPKVRYDMEVTDDFDKVLGRIAMEKGTTREDVIRRAVASYYFIQKELQPKEGGKPRKLSITNEKDEVLQDIDLP